MRTFAFVLLGVASLCFTVSAQAGEYNEMLSIGDKAPEWKGLMGVDGEKHAISDLKDKEVLVVIFTCVSCDVATDYEDRIIAFAKKYGGAEGKVGFVAINVNKIPADSIEKMTERAKEKEYPFPYLSDPTQKIGKAFGAIFTPEFYVFDKERKLVYMGGMDDNSSADQVEENFLEPAVQAALNGTAPKITETLAIGCRVRYARERRKKD